MMLDILRRSQTLKNVLLVITKNKKSLILTLILLVIIGYVYSVWGFIYLGQYYQIAFPGQNYSINSYCSTLVECFTSTICLGVREGGGVGNVMYPTYISDSNYPLDLFYDITFFIIITVIFLNIIFGIIVDTFAELRDAKKDIEENMENVCFVCSREKREFELRGSGWGAHIELEHNMWAYLAYMIYIRKKPITECDGIEKYVKNKLVLNDVSFFPTSSLCLEEGIENANSVREEVLKTLDEIEIKLKAQLKK